MMRRIFDSLILGSIALALVGSHVVMAQDATTESAGQAAAPEKDKSATTAEAAAAPDKPEFADLDQKLSYIMGTQVIQSFKSRGLEIHLDSFMRGIQDAMAGRPSVFSQEEMQQIMEEFRQVQQERMMKAQAEMQKKMAEEAAENGTGWKLHLPKPVKVTFDKNTEIFWNLETSKGKIRIKLMPQVAPMHVTSTIYLTQKGFYNDTVFHRVIQGFMAQGGCPLGTGTGSPGYEYEGEFDPAVKFDRPYLLAMANAGPGTDGSQFFITFKPTPHLNGRHTIFGEVVEGKDVVDALEKAGSSDGAGKTSVELKIIKATIEAKGGTLPEIKTVADGN